jgi:hypothetical protein
MNSFVYNIISTHKEINIIHRCVNTNELTRYIAAIMHIT